MSAAFTAPVGGVMTREVGAISGDLEIVDVQETTARVRYVDAQDVYTVEGDVPDGWDAAKVTAWLSHDPGVDEFGNARATTLKDA